ncbi:hypothetical protein GIB67_000252 [Kingdonia uniflora]|uniref:Uncharacterized protein n=1 Tax=Kingdonia uniflora TaxID=39325 RepID=A0A7J7LCF7_9MAGN|nr:hypothetical protein GIB67_000252 [Kingdonia uniflora]
MSISSGRHTMSSDQMEDSSNLVPQRTSISPGLLQKGKALTLNEVGLAVSDKSAKFSTHIGKIAILSDEYELPLVVKDQVLIGANIAWKNKKCELRKVYDKYPIHDAKNINCPATTIYEDWERFVNLSFDPKAKIKSNVEKNPESKHYDVDDHPTSSHVRRHEREVGIHFFNFHPDEVVIVGRVIFLRNQINNPNEYDALVDLVIDEDAEVSGRRGIFFCDIPVGEWFKYPSFLLKIIDEDATNRCNEILYCTSEHSSKGYTRERNLQADPEVSKNGWKGVQFFVISRCVVLHPRCEVMDLAILRPRRLGKLLKISLPSPDDRHSIFKNLARGKPIDNDDDLLTIAHKK